MPEDRDVASRLQAILAQEFDASERARMSVFLPTGSHIVSPGFTRWDDVVAPGTRCIAERFVDVTGSATTDDEGTRTFRLLSALCDKGPLAMIVQPPVNVVATPTGQRPFFMTAEYVPVRGFDVEITVRGWEAGGSPAPNVPFDWRCRAVLVTIDLRKKPPLGRSDE